MQITGGFLNSRKIKTDKFQNIKPTLSKTRQAVFNALASLIDFEDKSFLDMFAGSGIISFEAISRGFNPVYTFEKDKDTYQGIKDNFVDFKLDYNLYLGKSLKLIEKLGKTFDVIFIDPPYESDMYERSLSIIKNKNILNPNGVVIVESPESKIIDFSKFEIIKQKSYGNTKITFLENVSPV